MSDISLLSVADFCEAVGISRSTWHTLARQKKTPPTIRIGRSVKMRRKAVEEWLSENEARKAVHEAHENAEGPSPLCTSKNAPYRLGGQ